ncbi:MAG: phosphate ABC transporter permease PstA [Timaviella obliquedivisa GSE-PSE-MK23-08B]|jgi:phosphate transport system permease protein|nr:phosphate ABC transporter permease PstA [Timaviella obliquedivisa GSE-PSE-MK23-08B]
MQTTSEENLSLEEDLRADLPIKRQLFSYGMTAIALLLTALAILPLFSILFSILQQGLPQLNWQTFTTLPSPTGSVGEPDGFGNAIIGTAVMVGIASLISIPIGIMTAIFLAEFSQGSAIAGFVRFVVTILSGVPSIVVGVFAYGVIVLTTKEFSALAGSFALAVVMLPIVVLSTESALLLVPTAQKLASAGLGASRFQTTFKVVLASALPGIMTGILLAIARAAGETAPLIFTALFSTSWFDNLLSPTSSLSVLIYNYISSGFVEKYNMAWTAALVLLGLIMLLNLSARLLTRKKL